MVHIVHRSWLTFGALLSALLLIGVLACGGSDSTVTPAAEPEKVADQGDQDKKEYQEGSSSGTTFVTTPTPASTDETTAAAKEDDFKVGDRRLKWGSIEIKYGEPQYGGIMQVQHLSPARQWDPHGPGTNAPQFSPLTNTLLQFNPWTFDRYDIWGDLAVSWESNNDDGTDWTFKLNKDATWQDGSPVTAHDIVFSFDRMLGRNDNHAAHREAQLYFKPHIDQVTAVDDHTLNITLLHKWADFIGYMADDAEFMVQKAHYEALDANTTDSTWDVNDGWKNNVTSGPFIISNVVDGNTYSFVKNPIYWKKDAEGRALPYLDGMDYFVITDRTAAQAAWEAEQVWNTNWQTNGNMNPGQMKDMIERSEGKFVSYPAACCPDGFALNTSRPPFDNIKVRQALLLALDRGAFNDLVWAGLGTWSTTAGTTLHPLTMSDEEIMTLPGWRLPKDEDVAAAKVLLAEAGYPDGFSTTIITGNRLNDQDKGPVLQDQLKRFLNIEVDQIVLERLAMTEAMNSGSFDMITWGSGAGVITPDQYLNRFYALDQIGNPHNWVYGGPEDLLGLIAQQAQELDVAKRKALVHEIEMITLTKDSYYIVVFNRTFARLFNTHKVGGQNPTQSGYAETKAEQLWLLNP